MFLYWRRGQRWGLGWLSTDIWLQIISKRHTGALALDELVDGVSFVELAFDLTPVLLVETVAPA